MSVSICVSICTYGFFISGHKITVYYKILQFPTIKILSGSSGGDSGDGGGWRCHVVVGSGWRVFRGGSGGSVIIICQTRV